MTELVEKNKTKNTVINRLHAIYLQLRVLCDALFRQADVNCSYSEARVKNALVFKCFSYVLNFLYTRSHIIKMKYNFK